MYRFAEYNLVHTWYRAVDGSVMLYALSCENVIRLHASECLIQHSIVPGVRRTVNIYFPRSMNTIPTRTQHVCDTVLTRADHVSVTSRYGGITFLTWLVMQLNWSPVSTARRLWPHPRVWCCRGQVSRVWRRRKYVRVRHRHVRRASQGQERGLWVRDDHVTF